MRGLRRVYGRHVKALLPALLLLAACATPDGGGQARGPGPLPGCPARSAAEVPAEPTADTVGRLVPAQAPTSALVCRYDAAGAATGEAELTAGLDAVPTDLLLARGDAETAGDCAEEPGPLTPVLLRLAYPDGVVWLATTEQARLCGGTTNGQFASGEDVGDVLVASAEAGRWTVPALPDADQRCVPQRTGRLGQETALLPAGVQALTLCRVAGDGVRRRTATAQERAVVEDVLSEPVAVLDPRSCTAGGEQYELAASYGPGRAVLVRYAPGCAPDVDNGSLRADLQPADRDRLEAVLRGG